MESWAKHKVDYLPASNDEGALVNGRLVPHVRVQHLDNGRLWISVGIHGFDCDIFDGEAILGLVADAVAVGAGYVSWPDADEDFVTRSFAARWTQISGVVTDEGDPS